jgi:phospholipase C
VFPNVEKSDDPLTDIRGVVRDRNCRCANEKPDWKATTLVVSRDEIWGVLRSRCATGGRDGNQVPALIISARARPGYVDHTTYDFSPVPKLIETRLGLSPLSARDAEAQDIGGSLDMS